MTGLAIDQVGGDVTVGAVHTQIETFVQRALTAAEQAERAREIETRLLARGVGDFARSLQAQVHPIRPLGPAAGNPYKGLLAYDLGDADLFFGRADDIRQLFDRLRQSRLTILQAESGAGKTSLLGAGIAPRLIAAGHLPVLLRPYDQDPGLAVKQAFLSSLADAPHLAGAPLRDFLRRIGAILGPETAVVIFMDQFEEFFVFRKEADRPAFVHALAECLEDKGLNVGWVLALRTESFGRLATFRPRIDPFKNEYYLSQLGLEQARAAVVEPAARHNVTFEPGLVDELLKVLSDRGQIAPPQLQLVCSALYEGVEAEGGVITRTLYEGQGGVAGILNNYLDRVLQRRFFGDMRDQAYAVLTALVTSEGRRARCTRDELASDPASQGVKAEVLDAILPELVNSRLIGLRELGGDYRGPAYELVHDYLAERIQLDPAMRARKAAKELLDDAVEAYRKFGDKALLGADQLAIVEAQRPHFAVNKQAEELLAKSRDVIRRAQEAEKRRARRITWASVGAAIVLLILALMFLGQRDEARKAQAIALTAEAETVAEANIRATAQAEAIAQRDEAVRQANIALARQLAAQAQVTFRQPQIDAKQIGTLLAVESHRRAPSLEAYLILQEALGVFPVQVARLTHDDRVWAVAFSPECASPPEAAAERCGKWVVSGSGNTARVWEAASGREVARMTHDGYVLAVAFSPDGQWVASGSGDKTARVWEAISRREVARMTHDGDVNAVAFSPDGQRVASGSLDGTARVWEAASGREVARRFHGSSVTIVAFSPDGQWMVSSSADYMVMEAASGREVAHMTHLVAQGGVSAIAFSPECASPPEAAAERCGKWMVSGSGNTARVWEAASGQEVARMTHNDSVTAVAFSPDGKWVVSGGGSTARVWEAASGREVARMTHDDIVLAVAFSPDGQWVVSGSDDNTARVWEAASGREVARMTHDGPVTAVAFSPECASPPEAAAERCGKWVASSSEDRTARVWDATSGREIARMTHDSSVSAVAFSPDGQWVASGSNDNTARVWDISAALPGLTGRAGNAGAVSGREIARMTHDGDVTAVAFSPECASPPEANAERCGKWVVSSSADNTARVWFWQPADMIAAVCAGLPRNFTRAEWKQYLGDEPYRATCPNPLEE